MSSIHRTAESRSRYLQRIWLLPENLISAFFRCMKPPPLGLCGKANVEFATADVMKLPSVGSTAMLPDRTMSASR